VRHKSFTMLPRATSPHYQKQGRGTHSTNKKL
jgi:hypothetical protein